jgi:superfamily II DNA or RNA helicase
MESTVLSLGRGAGRKVGMLREGQIVVGPQFSEPMAVETVRADGVDTWVVGLVGERTQQFRRVTLTREDLQALQILERERRFDGDGQLLRLGLEAYRIGIAYEFDPYFGLSISRVDPLPHQLEAVYHYLLKLGRVRFLLADDAGAGKTIMAGLLLRELKLRGLVERTLVVCPANLTFQWQRELKEKFGETFVVLKGGDIREQFGVNQWQEHRQIITSLDLAKREDILPGLRQVVWDLVIVDEAHRMSASDPEHKTQRYRLGELLRDRSDHLLLLTATPHKGDPVNFSFFLQLLDQDAFADVRSIREAMERRRAPFYLRRTKEAMVYFPEQQADGTWVTRKIFTRRIPRTVDFHIAGDEYALYRDVTRFVKRQSAAAAAREDDPRARAVGFLMALYQRRLASSTYALRRSLENRAERLSRALEKAQELARLAPPQLPGPEEFEEMEDAERERLEEILAAVTLAQNAEQVREEIAELQRLVEQAKAVEARGAEAKLTKLHDLLQREGFFDRPDQRLLIFTEFKDTLDYLVARLGEWGFRVGFIHGGLKPGSRDEPGTRLHAEGQFWEGAVQILVATEAAGEGINLHCCHIMVNYDIPWNPNRLEQRMGRIHRYGQRRDCLIFNFVATNTVEGHVLGRLLEKLQEIRDALDDDSVFNVVGEILSPAHVERVLRDYYAGRLGEADLEARILEEVEEERFRAICQHALEGLATKSLNIGMLVERRALARERRIVPETLARFLRGASAYTSLQLREVPHLPHTFELVGAVPGALRQRGREPGWRYGTVASRYPRFSTDRETAERHSLEWVTPGHPLFEAVRLHVLDRAQEAFRQGACFYSLHHDRPVRLDFYRAQVVDGLDQVARETLVAVEVTEAGARLTDPAVLGNLTPAPPASPLPAVASLPEPSRWLHETVLRPLLEEVRRERAEEVERIAHHVELSLTELIARADEQIGRFQEAVERGDEGARGLLAQAEARHQDYLERRERRRRELERQKSLTLQGVERIASVLVLPHPEREDPEVQALRPDPEVEAIAMRVAMEHERAAGRQVYDVHEQNLGYDLKSVDPRSGELRLIEVKGLSGSTGRVLLTPNERRVAEDRRDCYWLYVVADCRGTPRLHEVRDPARFPWHEVTRVEHYWLEVDALRQPMQVREPEEPYGGSAT